MTNDQQQAEQVDLLPCPWCDKPLTIRNSVNAYGRCDTPDCWMRERKMTVPLHDPTQVAAWNTRESIRSVSAAEGVGPTEQKLRMVISHATGGNCSDTSLSTNDICVRISANRNMIYQAGKDAALASLPPSTEASKLQKMQIAPTEGAATRDDAERQGEVIQRARMIINDLLSLPTSGNQGFGAPIIRQMAKTWLEETK